jgi:DinB superfamily
VTVASPVEGNGAADAERTFGQLNREQLNWKRGAGQWSVAQCFEHLIKIDCAYSPQLRLIELGAYTPTWRDHVPLLGRFFGSMILRDVEPSIDPIAGDIIVRFSTHQQEMVEHMTVTGRRDLRTVVITSAVAPIAFYSALDAFRILVAHQRRHMGQAERVIKADSFPQRQVRDTCAAR